MKDRMVSQEYFFAKNIEKEVRKDIIEVELLGEGTLFAKCSFIALIFLVLFSL